MNNYSVRFQQYYQALKRPFVKLCKLEFLQPDNSVAFTLDNNFKRGYRTKYDTRAFIQDGTLDVNLNNGARRKATVMLANIDGAFDYAINHIWFGQKIRLSMGLVLPDGTDFYLPQGVFYIADPNASVQPNQQVIYYNLVDKWSYLNGDLLGSLDTTYQVNVDDDVFDAMQSMLTLSRYTYQATANPQEQIDSTPPVFTNYYNDKTYTLADGSTVAMRNVPYTISCSGDSAALADVFLELNTTLAGLIGYDVTGALRVEPSQDDINDADKPVLWEFTTENSTLCGIEEASKTTSVKNDVIIIGESASGYEVYGRATNYDPSSDTNVNVIGLRTYRESRASYWNAEQCISLAEWELKKRTVLQKSITIESSQIFHLMENRLISVKRTDKPGSPTEKHLIQSFSLPLGQTGSMSITATSVNDFPVITTNSSELVTEV